MSKQGIEHLKSDVVMAGIIERIGPIEHLPRLQPPFQSLVRAIVYQQLSGKAAGTIFGRFQALFDNGEFPTADAVIAIEHDLLRKAGLSRGKASYIKDLAQKSLEGIVPSLEECHALTDEELIERLTAVKGVGRWTVEMLLIFNLGRLDVLPVHDLGVRRGYQIAYRKRKMPEPEQLRKWGANWAPHRTLAALYLWRAADFGREE